MVLSMTSSIQENSSQTFMILKTMHLSKAQPPLQNQLLGRLLARLTARLPALLRGPRQPLPLRQHQLCPERVHHHRCLALHGAVTAPGPRVPCLHCQPNQVPLKDRYCALHSKTQIEASLDIVNASLQVTSPPVLSSHQPTISAAILASNLQFYHPQPRNPQETLKTPSPSLRANLARLLPAKLAHLKI